MLTYDEIIAASTARILRNARISAPLIRACKAADVSPATLSDGIRLSRTHPAWGYFSGGDLAEMRRIARLAISFIEARWTDFPKSAALEAALVALQAAIDEPD